MNNGDSFHNGAENLELQRQNRLGIQNQPSAPATRDPSDTTGSSSASAPGSIRVSAGTTGSTTRSTPISAASVVGTKNAAQTPYYSDPTDPSSYQSSGYDEDSERAYRNKFNVASLVLSIASFAANLCCLTCLTPITAILAIIFGCVGRVNGKFESKGLAGFILGIVYCALAVLMILFLMVIGMFSTEYVDPTLM